jgi:hypothetical protein
LLEVLRDSAFNWPGSYPSPAELSGRSIFDVKPEISLLTSFKLPAHLVQVYIVCGFLLLIALSWINELTNLGDLLGSRPGGEVWPQAIIETIGVIVVGTPLFILVRRVLLRLDKLESMLTICAWCRKVRIDSKWVEFEEYLSIAHKLRTSHGICEPCAEGVKDEIAAKKSID